MKHFFKIYSKANTYRADNPRPCSGGRCKAPGVIRTGRYLFVLFFLCVFHGVYAAEFPGGVKQDTGSFLVATGFPKTTSDLSFVDRLQLMKDGYEPFETTYDENGLCIKNCAYPGMKLEDDVAFYERQLQVAQKKTEEYISRNTAPKYQESVLPSSIVTSPNYGLANCPVPNPKQNKINPTQSMPLGYPLNGSEYVTSSYGPRAAPVTKSGRRGSSYHYGIDLRAPTGTPVFSTLSGTVVTAGPSGDCGNMVKIKSADGFGVGFCHLDKVMVKKGEKVDGGCVIGLAGNTGNSGGAHLHYIVYDEAGAQINPAYFIKK